MYNGGTILTLKNNTFSRGYKSDGTIVSLIGVSTAGKVSLDPGGVGVIVGGNLQLPASAYANWGVTVGSGGYGIRDNAGAIEFKNSAGSWAGVASVAAVAGGWSAAAGVVSLTTGTDRVAIGAAALGSVEFRLEVIADSVWGYVGATAYNNGSVANVPGFMGRAAAGTLALPTATTLNLPLLQLLGRGHDGTAFTTTSNVSISMLAAELFSPTNQGTYMTLSTTPLGTTARTEKLRLGPSDVVVNENGGDYDLRAESDANPNLLVMDSGVFAGAGAYGLGGGVSATAFINIVKPAGATTVFEFAADNSDPTGGGGAATGRIPITIAGATRYIPYYT